MTTRAAPTLHGDRYRLGRTSSRPLVVAICSGRLTDLGARWQHNIDQLGRAHLVVVLDLSLSDEAQLLAAQIRARGGQVLCHGRACGLSAARNTVLETVPNALILFVDDDVLLDRATVEAVRAAFADGAHIVGTRLVPPYRRPPWPRFFTAGQMHLVGWHSPDSDIRTWGGCMGVDAEFANRYGLRFNPQLGRTGSKLRSGEDTSFVAEMKFLGANETLLPEVRVVHDIDPARLTVRYLLRRAFWQGRTEARRRQAIAGLQKEWRRHCSGPRLLAVGYVTASVLGVAVQSILSLALPPGRMNANRPWSAQPSGSRSTRPRPNRTDCRNGTWR